MDEKKENKIYKSDFDGHLEKTIQDMTPSERIDYLWQFVELRLIASNRIKPESLNKNE
jgi:hypothetical protein